MKRISLLFFLALPMQAMALVAPEMIQRQQQEQMDADMRAREIDAIAAQSPYVDGTLVTPVADESDALTAGRCVDIKTVAHVGNTILSNSAVRKITRRYTGQCLNVGQINQMLNDITNAYIDRGYATSRAFMEMPQPRLRDGILDIRIIEGKINKFDGDIRKSERITAFPLLRGRALNIRDIEQGLDQMNRLGSNRASMDVRATPDMDGVSDIVITNNHLGRVQLGATLDNNGTDSTGEWRAGIRGTVDNIFGINDQVNLSLSNSLVDDMGNRVSRSAMIGMSVPFGYWTFSNNFSYSYYKTSFPMPISHDRFFSLGDSYINTTSIDRILWRGQTYKIGASASLTYKNNENRMRVYDLETTNDSSTRSLALLDFDVPITLYFPRGMVYVKPGLTQGVRIFGAADDRTSPYSQSAQYTAAKIYAYTGWQLWRVSLATSIDAQWSDDELYSTESFYLGGNSSVRGFRNESSTGDSGFVVRNDLDINLGKLFGTENKWVAAWTPGVFFDYGMTFPNSAMRDNGTMSGAGAKLGFKYWLLDASATYARALESEDWMDEKDAIYVYVGISGRF